MRNRRWLLATVALLTPLFATAQSLPWRAGVRIAEVNVNGDLGTVTGLDIALDGESGSGFEVAAAYRVAPTWDVELSLLQSSLTLRAESATMPSLEAGDADLTVIAATLQYRFLATSRWQPYLGVGVHSASLSGFSSFAALVAKGTESIEFDDSVSVTALIGARFALSDRLAVDLRGTYHDLGTDADLIQAGNGAWGTARVDVDPWAVAAGIDVRF